MSRRWIGMTLACALVGTMAGMWVGCDPPAPPVPASQPTSAPTTTTAPATQVVEEKKPPTDLIGVVLANDPAFPSTQPLADSVSLVAAARLKFEEPVYLCPRGDLWITRADAPSTQSQLKLAFKQQTHALPDVVQFVYWRPGANAQAEVIGKIAAGDVAGDRGVNPGGGSGGDVWITPAHRVPLDPAIRRDWSRAMTWNTDATRSIVVPTTEGMSILSLTDGVVDEKHIKLADPGTGVTCSAIADTRGILAWSTTPAAPSSVARFVDGKWSMITPAQVWPAKLLHVIAFQDGSVLAIGEENQSLVLRSLIVEAMKIDETRVLELVKQLADRLPEIREQAQVDLANLGPSAWPTLTRVQPTQPAEARIRIRAILGDQVTPTISGMKPEPGRGRLVCRLSDGGIVLFFEAGVSSVRENYIVETDAPAWLAIRPGASARMLPPALTHDQRAASAPIRAWGDEWILEHDVDGPMRWMGNHLDALTKPNEKAFRRFAGIDSNGRWVIKTIDPAGPTLVIDPTLLDPKPKLPVWTIDTGRGSVGWDEENWPVMKRGGAWVLHDGAWAALKSDDKEPKFKTSLDAPTTAPTTEPTTSTSRPAALLVDSQGNQYSDGLKSLSMTTKDGKTLTWPLPDEAIGDGVIGSVPVLIEAAEKLFLCNSPGKIIRITRQLDKAEPFKLDAVFTRNIPATDIRRIWKDPAGRLVIASRGSTLSVAFPEGMISTQMSNMIPAKALNDALSEENEETAPKKP